MNWESDFSSWWATRDVGGRGFVRVCGEPPCLAGAEGHETCFVGRGPTQTCVNPSKEMLAVATTAAAVREQEKVVAEARAAQKRLDAAFNAAVAAAQRSTKRAGRK